MATSRISGWDETLRKAELPVPLTDDMFQEAVDNVMKDVEPASADVVRKLWAMDAGNEASSAYLRSRVEHANVGRYNAVGRAEIVCPYALDDVAPRELQAAYPEFSWVFRSREIHDHPVPAMVRKADTRVLLSKLPPGRVFKDIGGDLLMLIDEDVPFHRCGGLEDQHDAGRSVLTRMRIEKNLATPGRYNESQAATARRVLAGDKRLVCGLPAQKCDFQAMFSVSTHVYDIPMEDWPGIMEAGGISYHQGAMHFSERWFSETDGTMAVSRARFVIEPDEDQFHMGFEGSKAKWYNHKWSDLLRYGASQVMRGNGVSYSYRIVSRRCDGIEFEIVKLPGLVLRDFNQYYRLPEIDMVQVSGFALSRPGASSVRPLGAQTYLFPLQLWSMMVNQATTDVERGGLDYNKLMNYYRTIAPRHTINSMPMMGGQRVENDLVVPLIVHAGIAAMTSMLCQNKALAKITGDIVTLRTLEQEWTVFKALDAFLAGLTRLGMFVAKPFTMPYEAVTRAAAERLRAGLVSVEPVVRLRRINMGLLVTDPRFCNYMIDNDAMAAIRATALDLERYTLPNVAGLDPGLARTFLDEFSDVIPDSVKRNMEASIPAAPPPSGSATYVDPRVSDIGGAGQAGGTDALPPLSGVPLRHPAVQAASEDAATRILTRRDAIAEALREVRVEAENVLAECERHYQELTITGEPGLEALLVRQEHYRNADLWFVNNGYFVRSLLGADPKTMQHSAAYVPVRPNGGGARLRTIYDEDGVGPDGELDWVYRRFDDSWSGWALVSDATLVFNGPALEAALEAALALPDDRFRFSVEVVAAVAGAGKTYEIKGTVVDHLGSLAEVVVVCPVKQSIEETRGEIVQRKPEWRKEAKRRVRTLDSLLIHDAGSADCGSVSYLLADEVFMAHSGKWYALAALLGVRLLRGYGDPEQIFHVTRAQVVSQEVAIRPDVGVWRYVGRRNPPEVVAGYAEVYDFRVRTTVDRGGYFYRVKSHVGLEVPRTGSFAILCMYQADKKELKRLFSRAAPHAKIMTTHESEGKTFDDVWLFNFEKRLRGPDDKIYLFNRKSYCLVAVSRARRGTVYVKESDVPDMITDWIAKAKDTRRVAAVMDIKTEGERIETI